MKEEAYNCNSYRWQISNVCDRDVGYDTKWDGPRTSLHHTKFAVDTPKNLRLPPNLKVETITSWKISRKASSWILFHQILTANTPLHSPCTRPLPAMGPDILTAINLITPQIVLWTMLSLGSLFASLNFKFFIRDRSSGRLKYCNKRVIFHETPAFWTYLFSSLLATNHRTIPPVHRTATPCPSPATFYSPSSFLLPLFLLFSRSLSPSLSTSKLLITLAADNLDRFELSACLPEYPLRIPAAPISKICALVSAASLICAQSLVEFSKDYFATPEIAVTAYMLISTHWASAGKVLGDWQVPEGDWMPEGWCWL